MEYSGLEYSKAAIQWLMHGDLKTAREFFEQAVNIDPSRCDAWLGIAYCELPAPIRGELITKVHQNMGTFGEDQQEAGVTVGYIQSQYEIGVADITLAISQQHEIRAAWATHLIYSNRLHDAYKYLEDYFPQERDTHFDIITITWILLWRAAKSWGEVLKTAQRLRVSTDVLAAALGEYFFGEASAHLGQGNIAHDVLFQLGKNTNSPDRLSSEALLTKALLHRTEGDSAKANTFFDKAYQLVPSSKIMDIKADESIKLTITSEQLISERTDFLDPATEPSLMERENEKLESQRETLLEEAEKELEQQIGMKDVKERVMMLKAKIELGEKRKQAGLPAPQTSKNLALTGPPGTGKTTIARVLAKIYAGLGVIAHPTVLEVGRKDLVGEHLGSTAPRTQAVLDKARGGVLFIDEAYTLNQSGLSGGDAFGKEAIDTILTYIENHRDEIIIILAGYDEEIEELLDVNPGLRSRVPKSIKFSSYSPDELVQIADALAKPRGSLLNEGSRQALRDAALLKTETKLDNGRSAIDAAGNGRWVRNVIEAAEDYRDFRISSVDSPDNTQMMTITAEDVKRAIDDL